MRKANAFRTVTRLWMTLAAGGLAIAAFGLDDAAQDVAGRIVEDAYAGNPLAIGILIAVVILATVLISVDKIDLILSRRRSGPESSQKGKRELTALHAHFRKMEDGQGQISTELAKCTTEIEGLRRDVDRLDREREAG